MEIWKDIEGYEGKYQVSSLGRVKSFHGKGRILKPIAFTNKYLYVNLGADKSDRKKMVHRLVASAFIENPENKREVNHKDGDKNNNRVENLEWMTPSENMQHSYDEGLNWHKGSKHSLSKLTEDDVRTIKVLLSIGENQKTIARAFSVSQQKISQINCWTSWQHINPFTYKTGANER